MLTESAAEKALTTRVTVLLTRRFIVFAVLAVLINVVVITALARGFSADADARARREIGRISEEYARRETLTIDAAATAAGARTKSLQETHLVLQRSLENSATEMDHMHQALVEKVLMSERIAKAMDDQKAEMQRHWSGTDRVALVP